MDRKGNVGVKEQYNKPQKYYHKVIFVIKETRKMENNQTKEIDIIKILQKVLHHKKSLILFISSFMLLGIIVALSRPKLYTANVVLAPEITSGMGVSNSIGNIASMMGINLNSSKDGVDAIYPQIYPDVLASNDFIIQLFNVKVTLLEDSTTKTYYNHLKDDYKNAFWQYPSSWIKKIFTTEKDYTDNKLNHFRLNKEQDHICSTIRNNIACLIDKETNVITINVTDEDPQVAAIMADTIKTKLHAYIKDYRTKKTRQDLEYAQKLYIDAKKEYEKARQKYGSFSDANIEAILESFKTKQEDLENDMQLKYNTYTQAQQQVQIARAKLMESIPSFTTIQEATVPLKASSMPRSFIVLIFIVIGFLTDVLWISFIKEYFISNKNI